MSDLAERLGRLPQGQRSRLLGRMRNQMTAGVGRRIELKRADHGPRSRSSFQQEQMWFVDKLGAGKARNNIALAIGLGGPLDRAALHEALNAVVARHQVLHSKLVEIDGVPWQEPVPSFVLGVQSTDLSGSEDADRELAELTASCAAAPFDLAAGPPVRAHLVRLAAERHVLLWVVHHIAWDPGSTRIFTEELTTSYAAAAAGKRPEAPGSPSSTPTSRPGSGPSWRTTSTAGRSRPSGARSWPAPSPPRSSPTTRAAPRPEATAAA